MASGRVLTARWWYHFDGRKPCPVDETAAEAASSAKAFQWVHVNSRKRSNAEWLVSLGVTEQTMRYLWTRQHRPMFTQTDDGFVCSFAYLRHLRGRGSVDVKLEIVRVWLRPGLLMTVGSMLPEALIEAASDCEIGDHFPKSVSPMALFLLRLLTASIRPLVDIVDEMEDSLEAEEAILLTRPQRIHRRHLSHLRLQSVVLHRYCLPQRDVIGHMIPLSSRWLGKAGGHALQHLLDILQHSLEILEIARERSGMIQDEITRWAAVRTNQNLYVVSVISAIFMPLSFVAGLFGMNVPEIPLWSFWSIVGSLTVVALLFLLLIRWKKML
jgi:zinc transporter